MFYKHAHEFFCHKSYARALISDKTTHAFFYPDKKKQKNLRYYYSLLGIVMFSFVFNVFSFQALY